MNTNILVKDIMTVHPTMVHHNSTLVEAAKKMKEMDCGILPVVGSELSLIGVMTDRDIITRGIAAGVEPNTTAVNTCMTNYIYFCYDTDNLENALNKMLEQDIGRLLVYDSNDKPCGIITWGSIIRHTMGKAKVNEYITETTESEFTD